MTENRMTDTQAYSLAEAAELLREFGHDGAADLVGRIMETELVLAHNPQLSAEDTRQQTIMVHFDLLVGAAKRIADNAGSVQITRALADLVATFQPNERERITAYFLGK